MLMPLLLVAEESCSKQLSLFAKGLLTEREAEFEEASELYQEAMQQDPSSFYLTRKKSGALSSSGHMDAAVKTMGDFAQAHRENLAAQFSYVNFLERVASSREQSRKQALEVLEEAKISHGLSEKVFHGLLSRYEAGEERGKSLALYEEFVSAANGGKEASYWLSRLQAAGILMDGNGEPFQKEKECCYTGLRAVGLEDVFVARKVSEHYRQQGRVDEAMGVLAEHIELVPSSTSLMTRMGILQLASGQEEEGEVTLMTAMNINPRETLAYESLAKHYEKQGQKSKALELRGKALEISGGSPGDFLNLANQYLDHGEAHPARLLLEKARFDHPDDLEILAKLAAATAQDGLPDEAVKLCRQAELIVEEAPEHERAELAAYLDADFQIEFSHLLIATGQSASAEERLRKAIRGIGSNQPKKSAKALCALAKIWIAAGKNQAAALSLLKRARSQDPENKEIKRLIEKLRER